MDDQMPAAVVFAISDMEVLERVLPNFYAFSRIAAVAAFAKTLHRYIGHLYVSVSSPLSYGYSSASWPMKLRDSSGLRASSRRRSNAKP